MDRNVGLWIDHRQAYAIWLEDGRIEVISSDIEPPAHSLGGTQLGGKLNQNGDLELHHNDRFKHQINKYYQRVMSALRDAASIFIMGPGTAKTEFEKVLKKNKTMQKRILKVETADKMTKNQMIAYVREFYQNEAIT